MADAIITDKAMQAAAQTKDIWLIEAGARGLGRLVGRITPKGERRFYYRYTSSSGERVRLPIGRFDPRGDGQQAFTVRQARTKALEWATLYSQGIKDLREHFAQEEAKAKRAKEAARLAEQEAKQAALDQAQSTQLEKERRLTLRQLFWRWQVVDLKPHIRADGKRAGRKDAGEFAAAQFGRYVFPRLGDMAVVDIRKADLLTILDEQKAQGKLRTCNMLLADMKQMFAFALTREVIERNPLDTVSRRNAGGTDTLRSRVLSVEEIKDLAQRVPLARLHLRTATGIWLLLATGARIGELMGAAWARPGLNLKSLIDNPLAQAVKVGIVDTAAKTWFMPTTKNEREHTIHLSDFAVGLFDQLALLTEFDANNQPIPWVFPNSSGQGPVCVKSFGKQLADRQKPEARRMSGRSKQTQSLALSGGRWTAHDLRRTAGTLMASLGVSGDVIDECLNHVIESRVRRTYIRDRRPIEQAHAFDILGAKLAELIKSAQSLCCLAVT